MPVLTEGRHRNEFMVSEAPGTLSRDNVTLSNVTGAAVTFPAGLVLGRRPIATATAVAQAGNTGNPTISAVTVNANAKPGRYRIEFTAATTFVLLDPSDNQLQAGATGTAYPAGSELGFTVTAGGTPAVAGDGFDITVAITGYTHIPFTGGGSLGAALAEAILVDNVTVGASSTKTAAVISRNAEVNNADLQWDAAVDASVSPTPTVLKNAARAALGERGIVVR